MSIRAALLALGFAAVSGVAYAAQITPVSIESSSTLAGSGGVTYGENHLIDGKRSNVWVEGDTEGSGVGTTLMFELGQTQTVSGFRIWNGNWYSQDFWRRHNRVRDLEVVFSDGSRQNIQLTDSMSSEYVRFDTPKRTSSMRLRILSVYNGSTFDDTVISEIQLEDNGSTGEVIPLSATDSSHLPEDGDGTYVGENMWDGLLDTMWCEGAEGDGAGEWFEVDFGRAQQVSALRFVNGNAYSLIWWMKSNRMTELTLGFSDGSSQVVSVRNSVREQTLVLDPVTTSSVRVSLSAVRQGNMAVDNPDYDCACVSEIGFVN
jgi:hypothetical protein